MGLQYKEPKVINALIAIYLKVVKSFQYGEEKYFFFCMYKVTLFILL